ncbi:MAG: Arc family DNA-binding protein [Muribaculaceae bacterium]|nr:Arc family DNA-binding protein [Muribaculaceae bacterium]
MAKQQNKGFLLRLDPEMMEQVEKWAAQEFRSVNGQIQWIISDALKRYGRSHYSKIDEQDGRD